MLDQRQGTACRLHLEEGMRRVVTVEEEFERQSVEYLRDVIREVNLLRDRDPFFDRVRALSPVRHVREEGGRFYFRFEIQHRGRPSSGPLWIFDPGSWELLRTGSRPQVTDVRDGLTPDSLLQAFREAAVAEVMSL